MATCFGHKVIIFRAEEPIKLKLTPYWPEDDQLVFETSSRVVLCYNVISSYVDD